MRIKVWMIVVAAGVLCLIWTALLLANRVDVYYGQIPTAADLETINAIHAHLRNVYLLEIGATILAALAVGFWAARKPSD
jgi:multisubunit Na+/H+ antiporter MnhB subunit